MKTETAAKLYGLCDGFNIPLGCPPVECLVIINQPGEGAAYLLEGCAPVWSMCEYNIDIV